MTAIGLSAALIAGGLSVSAPAMAVDAIVADYDALKTAVEALPAGESTITLAAGFAPVGAITSVSIPAGVTKLTLAGDAAGTTVAKAAGTTGHHLDLVGNGSVAIAVQNLAFVGLNDPDPTGEPGGVPGGGVSISSAAAVTVADSSFNGIDGASGLSLSSVTTLDVTGSSFLGNRASSSAALALPNGIVATISDSTIAKNHGTWPGYSGGAIRLSGKTDLTVNRTVFADNLSTTRGGAIAFHQMDGRLTITDSYFEGNTVPLAQTNTSLNDGGAIAVTERPIAGEQTGRTLISGTTFVDNVAADEGGAILAHSGVGSEVTVRNSTFVGNIAQGRQLNYDDSSGGGAIESFGTPLTLLHNTFVNNVAERGTLLIGTAQRGGAVSMYGDTNYLPTQIPVFSHNLFVGNDVLDRNGNSVASSAYRQVSASKGIESPAGELPPAPGDSDGVHTDLRIPALEDLELVYPPLDEDRAAIEPETIEFAADATNIGVDNGTAIDLAVVNRLAVLGTDTPELAVNGNAVVAGDPRGDAAQAPGTLLFTPGDAPYLVGIADNVGPAAPGITTDQRGFPVDDPADSGALQQAFVRFDPNGGDWADYTEKAFIQEPRSGERIVQRPDDAALVWTVGAVGSTVQTEPAPTTVPEDKRFAGWNTQPDGTGAFFPAGDVTIPAGNLRLYAQWEDDTPSVADGTVIAEYVDEDGNKLRNSITQTGPIGDPYVTEQLAFPGYAFVRVEGPIEGDFAEAPVTVRYHYEQSVAPPAGMGSVTAYYVDESGKALRSPMTQTGKIGASYQTRQLSFSGYSYVRVDGKATGVYGSTAARVTYVYQAKDAITPEPPVVTPPAEGGKPPAGGLASTGLDLWWPIGIAGAAALLIAAGVFIHGRRKPGTGGAEG
ncbi:hypothetical protein D3228_09615 [Leucobacter luti]|nr:hypothetical protein [Leucobacter luti]